MEPRSVINYCKTNKLNYEQCEKMDYWKSYFKDINMSTDTPLIKDTVNLAIEECSSFILDAIVDNDESVTNYVKGIMENELAFNIFKYNKEIQLFLINLDHKHFENKDVLLAEHLRYHLHKFKDIEVQNNIIELNKINSNKINSNFLRLFYYNLNKFDHNVDRYNELGNMYKKMYIDKSVNPDQARIPELEDPMVNSWVSRRLQSRLSKYTY